MNSDIFLLLQIKRTDITWISKMCNFFKVDSRNPTSNFTKSHGFQTIPIGYFDFISLGREKQATRADFAETVAEKADSTRHQSPET
jgi:hypothetical protein